MPKPSLEETLAGKRREFLLLPRGLVQKWMQWHNWGSDLLQCCNPACYPLHPNQSLKSLTSVKISKCWKENWSQTLGLRWAGGVSVNVIRNGLSNLSSKPKQRKCRTNWAL